MKRSHFLFTLSLFLSAFCATQSAQEQDTCKNGNPAPPLPSDITGHVNEPPVSPKLVKSPKLNEALDIKGLRLGMTLSRVTQLTKSSLLIRNGNAGARVGWYIGPDCGSLTKEGYQRCELKGSCSGPINVSAFEEARGLGGVRCDETIDFWLSPGQEADATRRIVAIAYTEGGASRDTHMVEVDPHHVKRVDAKTPEETVAQMRGKLGPESWQSYLLYPDTCHWVYASTWFSAETYKDEEGQVLPKYQLRIQNGTIVMWKFEDMDFDADSLTQIHKWN